jgi:hypothetical protein
LYFIVISFFGGVLLLSVIGTIGGFLHYRRERLLMHTERMKALEMGRELPDDPETAKVKAASQVKLARQQAERAEPGEKSFTARCYSMTSAICGTGFVFAWLAAENQGVALAIAAATGAIGVTGMICGTILASKPQPAPVREPIPSIPAKPFFDPEAV